MNQTHFFTHGKGIARMSKPATLYPGKHCLTEIVGFELVTAEEAASLAEVGFTTVEMPDGTWLAGQHYCQSETVTRLPIGRD